MELTRKSRVVIGPDITGVDLRPVAIGKGHHQVEIRRTGHHHLPWMEMADRHRLRTDAVLRHPEIRQDNFRNPVSTQTRMR